MSSDPGRTNYAGGEPLDVDPTGQDPAVVDPEAHDPDGDAKLKLQLAIFDVTRRGATGKSLEEIREMLLTAFTARDVAPPPFTWVESVASSAFYGEPYIIDYPTAIAADDLEAAPDETVRERLAARRKLRETQLPQGILPAPSEWHIPANEVTGGRTRQATMAGRNGAAVLALVALAAGAVVAVVALRLSRRPTGRSS
ncbi:hypothetical protein [Arthrobacter sp. NicSoilB11]|jgi:hypothetical protein|uniref:hypothetical protein n=1 Tax=Arthrobacter sp. NicSoilB11 TaxID=2830999 RepID=UPI001CC45B8D|nr:hypothetical protein [Arthrobacter sp. NicSoilB11]BCW76646.1 hypothetical protein NicSoilB11_29710 [Arthrobacter sp. NicSoilB11]